MSNVTAKIFDIQRNSYVDGPGIRTTVFFKGCNLRCAWCHNPEGQSDEPEWMVYPDRCVGCGRCADANPKDGEFLCFHDAKRLCGKDYTLDTLLQILLKDKAFYDASGGGVTFSGGECMLQIDFLERLLLLCKENGLHTAIDTAAHVPFERFERILPYTDLFLYDVKFFNCEKHRQYTGVGNERILENLRRLLALHESVWIRIPVIPSVNDSVEEMRQIKNMLDSFGHSGRVELLPYHGMGEQKCLALGKNAQGFSSPDPEAMDRLNRIFS